MLGVGLGAALALVAPQAVFKLAFILLAAIIAANAVAVFFQEGLHWFLPDNPTRYELLYDLGIRSR